jgi:hypothetical protein
MVSIQLLLSFALKRLRKGGHTERQAETRAWLTKHGGQAGAVGIIFVNHEDRLFDVIGNAPHLTVPVIAVALGGAESIPDGATVRFAFDESVPVFTSSPLEALPLGRPAPEEHMSTLAPLLHCDSTRVAAAKQPWVAHSGASPSPRLDTASLCSQVLSEDTKQQAHAARAVSPDASIGTGAAQARATYVGAQPRPADTGSTRAIHGKQEQDAERRGHGKEEGKQSGGRRGSKQSRGKVVSGSHKWNLVRGAIDSVGDIWLPEGWKMRMSRSYGKVFYYHATTGVRRWTRPSSDTPTEKKHGVRADHMSPVSVSSEAQQKYPTDMPQTAHDGAAAAKVCMK